MVTESFMADNPSNNKQIAKNLIFNSTSFAINFIMSFAFTPYLIRTVGKEAYSFFPLINNMIGYTSIITTAVGSMAGRFITMRIYQRVRGTGMKWTQKVGHNPYCSYAKKNIRRKVEAIRLVEEGNSPRSVSDRLHIGHHQIYEWLYIYKEKGVSGLENKRICQKNQYSFEKNAK